ncbi:MAG TPA: molybdopterin-dependent oxidoreductase [Bryobacteraceae bacterium]|nr:molybdopterin-dependent oxidoreductase [Bryobacteraceae bacterium]
MREPKGVEREIARKTRRAFLVGGIAAVAGVGGVEWLKSRPAEDGVAWPFREALRANESVARAYFRPARLSREYPVKQAEQPKANGDIGLDDDDAIANWKLVLEAPRGRQELRLDAVQALPRVELTTELRCIEGWSTVVHWTGARFADFLARYAPDARPAGYVGLETPDGAYYVGLEMASALHPQTLLAYAMNGEPLTADHGAPLRLVTPVKYGIKNIKRIGRIRFTDNRPADYWAERGYDWYAGL